MGSIQFNKQNGRLKRSLPGQDHYTGLVFYTDVLPAGFASNDRIKVVNDVDHAVDLGITDDDASLEIQTIHYHISELFRINPDCILWVAIFAKPVGAHTFAEIALLRTFADGKIRQIGVWTKKAYTSGDVALLQGIYNDSAPLMAMHEIDYSPNLVGVVTANLPDASALNSRNVHLLIAQDGGAKGRALYNAIIAGEDDFSVGAIGASMGAVSLAKVQENTGWVEKFNMAVAGGELDIPSLSNGDLIKNLSNNLTRDAGTFDQKRLIFLKTYPGYTGTYFNDTHGACLATDDYAYREDNRTMDKAIRGIYVYLVPKINGPVLLDKTSGQLSADYVEYIKLEAGKALEQMEKDGELSGYAVTIDPNQDVNATGKIVVGIANTKVGISRHFEINIGW